MVKKQGKKPDEEFILREEALRTVRAAGGLGTDRRGVISGPASLHPPVGVRPEDRLE